MKFLTKWLLTGQAGKKNRQDKVALPSQWIWKSVCNDRCTLFGAGTKVAVTRRSAPYDPATSLPRTPPPRTPAEAWLGQLLAELQRWPDAKCKCKLLWKPQQRRVPNPEQDLARGTSGSAPHIPLVSAAPRPQERPTRCFCSRHPVRKCQGCRRQHRVLSLCGAWALPGSGCLSHLKNPEVFDWRTCRKFHSKFGDLD